MLALHTIAPVALREPPADARPIIYWLSQDDGHMLLHVTAAEGVVGSPAGSQAVARFYGTPAEVADFLRSLAYAALHLADDD